MERTIDRFGEPLLKGLQVTNFKAFSTPIEVPVRPITLIFGANSVGKSSLIQSLLLLKQTLEDKSNAALLPRGSEIDLGSFYEFVHCHDLERSVSFKITTNMDTSGEPLDVYEPLIPILCKNDLDLTIALKFIFTYQKDEGEIICSSVELFVGEDLQPLAIFNPRPEKEEKEDQIHKELFLTKVNHEHSVIQRVWEDEVSEFKKSLMDYIENELLGLWVEELDKISIEKLNGTSMEELYETYREEVSEVSFEEFNKIYDEELYKELNDSWSKRVTTDPAYCLDGILDYYTVKSFAQNFLLYENKPIILDHFLPDAENSPYVEQKKKFHNLDDFPRFYPLSEFRNFAREHFYDELVRLPDSEQYSKYFLLNKDDARTIENLARKLWSRPDMVSEYLYKCLTTATRKLLDKSSGYSSGYSKALLNALAKEMNELIQGPLLYERTRFAGVKLSPQTKRLLERNRTGVELTILNRLLLEDAYPNEIAKCRPLVEYTDLGNILDSFLPNDMAIYAGKVLRQALSEIIYIGPLRQSPERFYTFQGAKTHQVGKSGERAFDLLWKNTETLAKVNKFLGKLTQEYSLKLLPLQSSGDEVQEAFTIRLYDSALTHANIADVGFGISQVLPVIVQSAFSTGKVLCIEQPELHLHPGAQAELGDLFIDSALTQSNTFIIETHSEHLLLRILRRIRETIENTLEEGQTPITPDDVQVIYAKYSPNGTKLYTLAITPDGDFADKWPDGFFEERAEELF